MRRYWKALSVSCQSVARMGSSGSTAFKAENIKFIQNAVQANCVVIFSKTTCSYCYRAKQVFERLGVEYAAVELNTREDGPELQSALGQITGQNTVPQVFVNGQCIGGGTETERLHQQGRLVSLLQDCQITSR